MSKDAPERIWVAPPLRAESYMKSNLRTVEYVRADLYEESIADCVIMQGEKVEAQAKVAALEQERDESRAISRGARSAVVKVQAESARLREAIREETAPYVNDSGPIGGLASRLGALTEGKNDD
jgi:hypothetical protein